jgi:phosphohistidine phosphatase
MKLYLVQHGNAVSKDENPLRPLSDKGRADAARVADFVRPLKITVDFLWHSKKSRAAQTAQILAEVIKVKKGLSERDDINPNDEFGALLKDLSKVDGDTMIVGHMPFLGRLASNLLSGSGAANTVHFRQGGILCLNYDKDIGWQIEWIITPDIVTAQ